MHKNESGEMICRVWEGLRDRYAISLHSYVVMPNHFHAILEIKAKTEDKLGDMIGAFKSITTNRYMLGVRESKWKPFTKRLWQRNYYEHIIRNAASYRQLSEYIENNPVKWTDDQFFV